MGYYADQIQEAATKLGVQVELIPKQEVDLIREQLLHRFAESIISLDPHPAFTGGGSSSDPRAWTWLSDVLDDEPVILFFYKAYDRDGFLIRSGEYITPLIDDCTPFPFFLTNPQLSFIICLEEHDVLMYVGEKIVEAINDHRAIHRSRRGSSNKSCQ